MVEKNKILICRREESKKLRKEKKKTSFDGPVQQREKPLFMVDANALITHTHTHTHTHTDA